MIYSKGIYNSLALIMCSLLDLDLAYMAFFCFMKLRLYEAKFNVMEIRFYSNQRKDEKMFDPGRVRTCNLSDMKLTP